MLQIVTGMYFRDVELNETVHRAVLHTNAHFLPRDPVALPVGELRPSTDWSPVTTVTVEVIERLEAVPQTASATSSSLPAEERSSGTSPRCCRSRSTRRSIPTATSSVG
ncbi:MAG: hypothetical protein ACR2JU_04410 [Nocardioidaceae bacterium]